MELYGNSVLNNTLQVGPHIESHLILTDNHLQKERIEQHQLKKSQSAVWSQGYSRAGQSETIEHGTPCIFSSKSKCLLQVL